MRYISKFCDEPLTTPSGPTDYRECRYCIHPMTLDRRRRLIPD
jgi:hypothetical protein